MRFLADHLGGDPATADPLKRARRFATVRHLADLFDSYALHRPDVVRGWAGAPDGHWQAELWRRLRERIGTPGPAERLEAACARLRGRARRRRPARAPLAVRPHPAAGRAPRRPRGARRAVATCTCSSCTRRRRCGTSSPACPRSSSAPTTHSATVPKNRLLASWGRDAREMQLVLAGAAAEAIDHHHPVAHDADTLLARIQADVRADRPPPALPLGSEPDARPLLEPGDRSLEIHACHGRARQVEVLRDAILHLLAGRPDRSSRATSSSCAPTSRRSRRSSTRRSAPRRSRTRTAPCRRRTGAPDLRVRLADRALLRTNPVLGVVAELLELAHGRVTASQVLDLAEPRAGPPPLPPRRRRHRAARGVGDRERHPLGPGRRPPRAVRPGGAQPGDVGPRRRARARRRDDDRGRPSPRRRGPAARRRRERRDRPGRPVRRARRPPRDGARRPVRAEAGRRLGGGDRPRRRPPRRHEPRATPGSAPSSSASSTTSRGEADASRTPLALAGGPRAARRAPRGPPDAGELPHRAPDDLHARADALGPAPRRLPARARRRGVPAQGAARRRRPAARRRRASASATRAPRTASSCSTRSWPRRSASSSRTPAADERTNARRPPAVPVGELLDVVDRTVRTADGRPAREHVVVRAPAAAVRPAQLHRRPARRRRRRGASTG